MAKSKKGTEAYILVGDKHIVGDKVYVKGDTLDLNEKQVTFLNNKVVLKSEFNVVEKIVESDEGAITALTEEKDAVIAEKEAEIATLTASNTSLQESLVEKEAEIVELTKPTE